MQKLQRLSTKLSSGAHDLMVAPCRQGCAHRAWDARDNILPPSHGRQRAARAEARRSWAQRQFAPPLDPPAEAGTGLAAMSVRLLPTCRAQHPDAAHAGRRTHTFGLRPGARHGAWFGYKKRFFKTDPARIFGGVSGHFSLGSRRSRSSGKRTDICAPPCRCDVASPAASTADAGPPEAPPPVPGGAAGNRSGSAGAHVPFAALVGGQRPTGALACGILNPKPPRPRRA